MRLEVIQKSALETETELYGCVGQSGFGRIDDTSSYHGLSTYGAAACVVIIGHCSELKRTILIHSQDYMSVKETLEPIFDWLVAKNEEKFCKWNSIDVVVTRGYSYNVKLCHNRFIRKIRDFFKDVYVGHSINIDNIEPLLQSSEGSVLVDKGTGMITILTVPLEVPHLAYSQNQLFREYFANDVFPFVYTKKGAIIKDRHFQFDIDRYTLHGDINDHCRLVLRAKFSLRYSDEQLRDLLKSFGLRFSDIVFIPLKETLELSQCLPCERCPKEGVLKCANCKGAWYCDRGHQQEDWKEHKRFCKLNSMQK